MRVGQMVRQLCGSCGAVVHERRFRMVLAVTQAIADSRRLSVTAIGRCVEGRTFPKHSIKRVDRSLSNPRMQAERWLYFQALAKALIGDSRRPVVLLDWTKVAADFHALVAAVPVDGRALPIYVEVHREKKLGNPHVQARFLRRLKDVLPQGVKPILVTDAGFRGPFFHELQAMDWDFVGRLRSNTKMRQTDAATWASVSDMYATATSRARRLGSFELFRTRRRLTTNLVLVGPRRYPRRHPWRGRSTARGGLCAKTVAGAKEPWLLVTSLASPAKRVVSVYAKRMQIEETFRDTKNSRFGWCLRHVRSHSADRLTILLLFAAIAMVAVVLVGMAAETAGIRRRYQANTTRTRVLSLFMLGLEILRSPNYRLPSDFVTTGLTAIHSIQRAILAPTV
jgi:hypothetical protein